MAPKLAGEALTRSQLLSNQIAGFNITQPPSAQIADWQARLAELLSPVWSAGEQA